MIYCVVPPELEQELYEKLVEYYKDNPQVQVMIDRRTGPDPRGRKPKKTAVAADKRVTRDRRRPRVPGTLPDTDLPEG
jgi:hypothetical protein